MEYPIDLAGGGQMSTKTLCEGIVEKSSVGLVEGNNFIPVVCCPRLLTSKEEYSVFEIVTFYSDYNREYTSLRRIVIFLR